MAIIDLKYNFTCLYLKNLWYRKVDTILVYVHYKHYFRFIDKISVEKYYYYFFFNLDQIHHSWDVVNFPIRCKRLLQICLITYRKLSSTLLPLKKGSRTFHVLLPLNSAQIVQLVNDKERTWFGEALNILFLEHLQMLAVFIMIFPFFFRLTASLIGEFFFTFSL